MSTAQKLSLPPLRIYQIWGAGTRTGKTVFSNILSMCIATKWRCKTIRRGGRLEPRRIRSYMLKTHDLVPGDSVEKIRAERIWRLLMLNRSIFSFVNTASVNKGIIIDSQHLNLIRNYALDRAQGLVQSPGGWLFVETLDQVESRFPSGTPQAKLYQPLGLPALLVCDSSSQEGIERTVRSFQVLRQHNYQVPSVAVFKDPAQNYLRIEDHFKGLNIPCVVLRGMPERCEDPKDENMMLDYYRSMARSNAVRFLIKDLDLQHEQFFEKFQ